MNGYKSCKQTAKILIYFLKAHQYSSSNNLLQIQDKNKNNEQQNQQQKQEIYNIISIQYQSTHYKNIIKDKKLLMNKLTIVLVLLSQLYKQIVNALTPVFTNEAITLPTHIYKLYFPAGHEVNIILSSFAIVYADLDVYVFYEGADLMHDTPVKKVQLRSTWREISTFQTDRSSYYYFRVVSIDMKGNEEYPYFIQIYSLTYSGSVLNQQSIMYNGYGTGYVIKLTNSVAPSSAIIKIQQQTLPITLTLKNIQTSLTENLVVGQIFCLPPNWLLVLNVNMESIYSLYEINFSMDWDISGTPCINVSETPNITNTTANTTTTSITAVIVICVTVPVCVIILFIVIAFWYRRYYINKQGLGKAAEEIRQVGKEIKNDSGNSQQAICAICLHDKCDAFISCKHPYHKKCIQEWLKINDLCPICKKQFKSNHIIETAQGKDTNKIIIMDF